MNEQSMSVINILCFQALSWWCWAEHLKGWGCDVSLFLNLMPSCWFSAGLFSYPPILIHFFEDHCPSNSWDRWKDQMSAAEKSVAFTALFSFPNLPKISSHVSRLYSLAVNLKQNSTHNHMHSSDVRFKSLLTVLLQWHMPHRIEKEDPSLTSSEHWCFHWWSCQSLFLH